MPSPAYAKQPRPRRPRWWLTTSRRQCGCTAEAVEPRRRRARVETGHCAQVLRRVGKHVDQRVAHHARCPERDRVPALGPRGTATAERAVHGKGAADRRPAHAARQRLLVVRLDDQVEVIALHRVLPDAEVLARSACESASHCAMGDRRAKPDDFTARTQRDEHRLAAVVYGARPVRHGWSAAWRTLSPGATTSPAPARTHGESEHELALTHHRYLCARRNKESGSDCGTSRMGYGRRTPLRMSSETFCFTRTMQGLMPASVA